MAGSDSTLPKIQKVTGCMLCGTPVTYKTNSRVHCPPCRATRKRERARETAERLRRSAGVAAVKGTVIQCKDCGQDLHRSERKTVRCKPCQYAHALQAANNSSRKRSDEKGARKLGSNDACKHCESKFVVMSASDAYCGKCKVLRQKNQLPRMKEWFAKYRKEWAEKTYKGARREEYQAMCRAFRQRRKERLGHAFTINERMSASIRQSLRLGKNGWRWEALAGYTLQELIAHLGRQFTKGMTWDDVISGKIHIDHIVAKIDFQFSSFEDPEFKRCWALSNLRPMWAKDNIQKRAQRLYLL